ncbi:Protein C40H1.2, partial [Aphelenchoides avenae]
IPDFYRVVHKNDPVTGVPKLSYFHHKTEIWYDNDMAPEEPYKVCQDPEGKVCAPPPEVPEEGPWYDPHRYYFDVMVSQFGIGGCVRN